MMVPEIAVTGDKEDKKLTVKCSLVSEDLLSSNKLMQFDVQSACIISLIPIIWNETSKQITSNDLSCQSK